MTDDDQSRFGTDPEKLFRDNLEVVEDRISEACARAGRMTSSVKLLPVTKTVPSDILRHAFRAGIPTLRPRGLMTLAILNGSPEAVRKCFRRLRDVRDVLANVHPSCGIEKLSMGMTSDFEIAIEEGADVVRIGQAIFGKRPTKDGHFWPGLLP